jgi:hypothetical protein
VEFKAQASTPCCWKSDGKSARERLTFIRLFEDLRLWLRGQLRRGSPLRDQLAQGARSDDGAGFRAADLCAGRSHEIVVLNGATVTVKVAHMQLCHSRMLFARAYPRETQEMVFDAHDRSFAFFKGVCERGVYDNMKTAVDTIFVGKDRLYNRRFLQMCGHYLVDPVACTPASGWEKGQVENQVGLVRERFFTPRLRCKSLEELNAWLLDKCVAYAKAHRHPEIADKTIREVFEDYRPKLVPLRGRFDSFRAGLIAVEAACAEALAQNVRSADVILNISARRRDPGPPLTILTPDALRLRCAPVADCARYDRLRSSGISSAASTSARR